MSTTDISHISLSPEQRKDLYAELNLRSDRIIEIFLFASFALGIGLAFFYDTWLIALGVGGTNLIAYFLTKRMLPEQELHRYVVSAVMAVFMAQFIYQMHGLFEMHFFAFVSCTLMITYANWRLQLPLFIIIVLHHGIFAYLQFAGVEGVYFTQLPYMDLLTFLFHVLLAGVIIFICGLWSYHGERQILRDGHRTLLAEASLKRNLSLAEVIKNGHYEQDDICETDSLSVALDDMRTHLRLNQQKEQREKYVSQGISRTSKVLSDLQQEEIRLIGQKLLQEISPYIDAQQASFFLMMPSEETEPYLQLIAGYAFETRKKLQNRVALGEGLIGQAALEQSPIFLREVPADYIMISSSLGETHPRHIVAWPLVYENQIVGVLEFATLGAFAPEQEQFLREISSRIASSIMMVKAQKQTQALLAASEALKTELQDSNAELAQQAEALQQSKQTLENQQKRLVEANMELEAQTSELEAQKKALLSQNQEIENARADLVLKAKELKTSSQYKSEFLANMSHELRTPLNSILILANMLSENQKQHLDEKEVQHAQVIHKAGKDLLVLINDILNLSKIESGRLDLIWENVSFEEIGRDMEILFQEVANKRQINLLIESAADLPDTFQSDRVRLEQILKNFLSNALKFTDPGGEVSLQMIKPDASLSLPKRAAGWVGFAVKDNGIGIPKDKQAQIFEAFRQADGSTSRKYGGTGLGLSISLKLAKLLGGEVHLESEENQGSTFTLYLPIEQMAATDIQPSPDTTAAPPSVSGTGQKVLLVEDQALQNDALVQLLQEGGYRVFPTFNGKDALAALQGDESFACVLLDLQLPDISGQDILRKIRNDLQQLDLPVIVHTAMDLDEETQKEILKYTHSVVIKAGLGKQRLLDEIQFVLGEKAPVAATSHPASPPPAAQKPPTIAGEKIHPERLKGKRILLVEDDIRNIFSVSAVLESYEIQIEVAENGQEALDALAQGSQPDLILLDLMMPEMDGLTCLKHIRALPQWEDLPVLILSAKAMQEDIQTCLAEGANDYLAKPLDTPLLLERIQHWISVPQPQSTEA